jgi:tetratricopeptide (TPR) repeat protein/TM2 domain-containing membrane protein YozV
MTALFLLTFTFAGLLLLRYAPLFARDVQRFLPRQATRAQGMIFGLALLLLPALFQLGLLYLALYWICATWLYLRVKERALAVLLAGLVAAVPVGNEVASRAGSFVGSIHEPIFECTHGMCSTEALRDLHKAAAERPDGLVLFALGAFHARVYASGNVDHSPSAAATHLRQAAEDPATQLHARIALGNLEAATAAAVCATDPERAGRALTLASQHYERALAIAPDSLAANYNSSLLRRREGDSARADALYAKAHALGGERLYRFEKDTAESGVSVNCPGSFNANRQLMGSWPTPEELERAVLGTRTVGEAALLVPFQWLWVGSMGHGQLVLFGGGALLFMIAVWLIGWFVRPAWYCSRCRAVSVGRTPDGLEELGICDDCLYHRIKSGFLDPKAVWIRDRRIQARADRRRRFARLLSFLVPGAGHVFAGRPVAGTLLALLFYTAALLALLWQGVLRDPYDVSAAVPWARIGLAAAAAVIVYVLSISRVYKLRDLR